MLSKSEREILKGLADLVTERDMENIRREELQSGERRRSTKKIHLLEYDIKSCFVGYSDNYRRVLKHRVKKKAQQMINDIIIVLQTCEHLGMSTEEFLPYDKHIKLRNYLPNCITNESGIDWEVPRHVSLKDLPAYKVYKDMQKRKPFLEKLGYEMKE